MISEHKSRKFPQELLSNTFSAATFGNGLVAIFAGLIATVAADYTPFHYVGPFLVALIPLGLSSLIVATTWNENYGNSSIEILATFTNAFQAFREDIRVPIIGMVQSLFEGSMYTFVFMWTPALSAGQPDSLELPYGLIFASFMVCMMIGSSMFTYLLGKRKMTPETIAAWVLIVSSVSLLVPAFSQDMVVVLVSFLIFEVCCGVYFPCMGTLRGKYVPEATRSAVMNFFRIPLNGLVILVLFQVGNLDNSTVFIICSFWLGSAWLLQLRQAFIATQVE